MTYIQRPSDYEAENKMLLRAATIPGNPLSHVILTTFDETKALAILRNSEALALSRGGGILIPRYLRLKLTTVPATTSAVHFAWTLDDVDRYSSGGSQIGVAANTTLGWTRSDSLALGVSGRLDFGAVVTSAAGANRKIISQGVLRSALPVVNDVFMFVFGDTDEAPVSQDTGGTIAKFATFPCDTVAMVPIGEAGAASSLCLHVWYPGNTGTAAQYELDAGWLVRK